MNSEHSLSMIIDPALYHHSSQCRGSYWYSPCNPQPQCFLVSVLTVSFSAVLHEPNFSPLLGCCSAGLVAPFFEAEQGRIPEQFSPTGVS